MNNKQPLYLSIMQTIRERILNNTYPIGSLIPTETEFEAEFGVSKITIRKAIELLERDGYVQKTSGRGTTVLSNALFNKSIKGKNFPNLLERKGKTLHKEKTNIIKVNLNLGDELYRYFGHTATKITRMVYMDGQPYAYMTYYLPGNLEVGPIEDDDKFSIYMLLYNNGIEIKGMKDEFYVDYPQLKIMEALGLKNDPVLGKKRMAYDTEKRVVEISYTQYNTRLANYEIELDI